MTVSNMVPISSEAITIQVKETGKGVSSDLTLLESGGEKQSVCNQIWGRAILQGSLRIRDQKYDITSICIAI